MSGKTVNFKVAQYLITHTCYPFGIYHNYLKYSHLPIEQNVRKGLVSRGQTAFFFCVWVGKKGSGNPSIEILCDKIARNWQC